MDEDPKKQLQIPEFFKCVIVTPDKIIFEGNARRMMAPGVEGELAILPIHAPFYSELAAGKIMIDGEDGQNEIDIDGGIIRARANHVTIIVGF